MSEPIPQKIEALSLEVRTDLAQSIHAALISAGRKAVRKAAWCSAVAILIVSAASWLMFKAGLTADDTDGESRSGLVLYTDAATGCQYLSASGSGSTPRMDKDGYQICGDRPVHIEIGHK